MTEEPQPASGDERDTAGHRDPSDRGLSGSRVITVVYVALVLLTGVFGYVIGTIRPDDLDPTLFFLVDLPPTPLGMAAYGMVTVGVVLGGMLALVRYAATTFDTAEP